LAAVHTPCEHASASEPAPAATSRRRRRRRRKQPSRLLRSRNGAAGSRPERKIIASIFGGLSETGSMYAGLDLHSKWRSETEKPLTYQEARRLRITVCTTHIDRFRYETTVCTTSIVRFRHGFGTKNRFGNILLKASRALCGITRLQRLHTAIYLFQNRTHEDKHVFVRKSRG
jgi:hypothetical protein